MTDYFTRLLGIQGFVVEAVTQDRQGAHSRVVLDIKRGERPRFICSGCCHVSEEGIEYRTREVQHLSCWQHLTVLRFKQYRVNCPHCGLKVEALPFVLRYSRVSVWLGNLVYELCKVMTNKSVGILQGLDDGTVKAIGKYRQAARWTGSALWGLMRYSSEVRSVCI